MVAFAADYAPTTEASDVKNRARGIFLAVEVRAGENGRESRHPRRGKVGLSYETASGPTNFLNRDPIEEQGGLNLYGFVGNDPVNAWDYLGLDFIAVGTRPVQGTEALPAWAGFNHMSIYYFEYCGDIDEGERFTYEEIPDGATKEGFFELLRRGDLYERRWRERAVTDRQEDIAVSVIYDYMDEEFSGHAERFVVIRSDSDPDIVKDDWDKIDAKARSYKYGLQVGNYPAELDSTNWPWVRYRMHPWATNSNTFIRVLAREIGRNANDVDGRHLGAQSPRRPADPHFLPRGGYPVLKRNP